MSLSKMKPICIPQVLKEILNLFNKLFETPAVYGFHILQIRKNERESHFFPQCVGEGCLLFKKGKVQDFALPLW
jgi:hypothetical protein